MAASWRPNERLAFVFGRHDRFMKTGSPVSREDIRSLTRVIDPLTRAVTVYPGLKSQSRLPIVGVITYFSLFALAPAIHRAVVQAGRESKKAAGVS
ncbi:hypothetical protein HUG15_12110 [Salicibibacter cibarius]|uniref:Uncharacterized protein n=1 Tax=Salicibibacter cibarius TaxID=2743000 RepID=A0A7T6Z3U7_9BACI|nr:hypothetical protein HUG15_12110 [Salicibibacter cibarius]